MPLLIAVLAVSVSGCSSDPRPADRDTRPTSETAPSSTTASLRDVDTATLPRLPRSQAAGLPARIPPIDANLPDLLDDLPGRAVMVVNPSITVIGNAVDSWSELEFLVYGVDGRWRRLNLGDLGLDESLRWYDTYGSGSLSSDGRWWTGPTQDGSVLLDMRTGAVRLLQVHGWWAPGARKLLTGRAEITIPDGARTEVPYLNGVGYEPDGTPLSLERGPHGEALLVQWSGRDRTIRAEVADFIPPRFRIGAVPAHRPIQSGRLTAVVATTGMVVGHGRVHGRAKVALIAVDSTNGRKIGELTWRWRDFPLTYDDWWIDEETLLIATRPYFLGWRPRTGQVFRVTDAHAVSDEYWDLTVASQAVSP